MKEECDIDEGDGTGGLASAKDRESQNLYVKPRMTRTREGGAICTRSEGRGQAVRCWA